MELLSPYVHCQHDWEEFQKCEIMGDPFHLLMQRPWPRAPVTPEVDTEAQAARGIQMHKKVLVHVQQVLPKRNPIVYLQGGQPNLQVLFWRLGKPKVIAPL